jgi:exosortase E/protease (VPEID-CTERM system)
MSSIETVWAPQTGPQPEAVPSMSALARRIFLLALLFTLELLVITYFLDRETLARRAGLFEIIYTWGAWILHGIVAFAAIFVTFAYFKFKVPLEKISAQIPRRQFEKRFLIAHFAGIAFFAFFSFLLYFRSGAGGQPLAAAWLVTGIFAIVFAALALIPLQVWLELFRVTRDLWVSATIAVFAACSLGYMAQWLWHPASRLTFELSKLLLSLFVSDIYSDPANLVIGTQSFQVQIAPECSGLEGIALILSFSALWLLAFRREIRFPRSFILIPLGVFVAFLLNSLRIATLILIGTAGAQQIALGGFHSQAGWIAFSLVSVGFCLVIQQVPWFRTVTENEASAAMPTENPTAAFLIPLLVIVTVGIIAGAFTGDKSVEWMYPLKFLGAMAALWIFSRRYANLNWGCDWLAPAIGALVFLIWIAFDGFANSAADHGLSIALTGSTAAARVTWIIFRVLASVVAVPLAEELAFRGFLMRRLLSRDFESVSFRRFSWVALLLSSVAYGLLHGGYWIAGSLAGVLFGLALMRKGRMGDAVVAHATANALLAAYVLSFHQWHLW